MATISFFVFNQEPRYSNSSIYHLSIKSTSLLIGVVKYCVPREKWTSKFQDPFFFIIKMRLSKQKGRMVFCIKEKDKKERNKHPQNFIFNDLCSWSRLNSMDFNIRKCKLMRIYKKKQPLEANHVMYDSSPDIVSEFKDFGLLVTHNLSWNSHVNRIVSNAKRMLALI